MSEILMIETAPLPPEGLPKPMVVSDEPTFAFRADDWCKKQMQKPFDWPSYFV